MSRLAIALGLCVPLSAVAVPMQLVHQGRLVDAAGGPIHGARSTTFSLYSSPTATLADWSETESVSYVAGYYTAVLGDRTPLPSALFASGDPLYVQVTVEGTALGARTPLASVPFAIQASSATTLAGASCTDGEILRYDQGTFVCVDHADHEHDRLPAGGGVLVTTATTCEDDVEGLLRYSTETKRLEMCDGSEWNVVYSLGPPRDCKEQLQLVPTSTSGEYDIDPDGDGDSIRVYCDMDYSDGGWIRVVAHDAPSQGTGFGGHAAKWDAVDAGMGVFSCSGSGVVSYANTDASSSYPMQFYRMDLTPYVSAREVRFVHRDNVVSWDGALLARVNYANNTDDTRIYDNHGCSIPNGSCTGGEVNTSYNRTESLANTGTVLAGFEWGVKSYQGGCGDYHQIQSYAVYVR